MLTNETFTYKQSRQIIETIAQNLYQSYNFRPGDHFGFYSTSSVEYLLVLLAVWRLRGVYVGVVPVLERGEVTMNLSIHKHNTDKMRAISYFLVRD